VAAEVLKAWPEPLEYHLPLSGRALAPGLKVGRPIAAGQPIALSPNPLMGALRAPADGVVASLGALFLTLKKGPGRGSPAPAPALDLKGLSGAALAQAALSLGVSLPPPPRPGETVVASALEPDFDLTLARALWAEWPSVMTQGLELVARLCPDRPRALAGPPGLSPPEGWALKVVDQPYPETLGPFLKRRLGLGYDQGGRGFFDSRTIYLLGLIARGGRPPRLWPLAVQGQNYLAPLGLRPLDVLRAVSLEPRPGDAVSLGGRGLGRPTARLSEGLGPETYAIRLVRARDLSPGPGPCRGCQACAQACPLSLPIFALAKEPLRAWPKLGPIAKRLLAGCPDCGQCALACPARRPLRFFSSGVA
jgi:ferredoxin